MHIARSLRNRFHDLLAPRHLRQAIARLRELESRFSTPEDRIHVPFHYRGRGHYRSIRPRQSVPEITQLYRRVRELHPRRLLEIGTARGGTLYLWAQAAAPQAQLISLDLPGGSFGGGYPEARLPFYQSFTAPEQTLHLLRADSHAPQSLQKVRDLLRDQPIDFLFIDGDHTFEGVCADYQAYAPLVRPGGLIALHDILPQPDSPETQVYRLWNEIKKTRPVEELINTDPRLGRTLGLGVIRA